MSDIAVRVAVDVAEARELLVASVPPNDSPTQLQLFSPEHIDRALNLGFRRADWVWVATDPAANPLGVVAGWGSEHRATPWILDFLDVSKAGAARHEVAVELLRRASADSVGEGGSPVEIIHFLPTDIPDDDPALAWLVGVCESAGFRLLVRRKRYRMRVRDSAVRIPPTELRFEAITGADDPRLVAILAEILVGSLDAHDVAALDQAGTDQGGTDQPGIDQVARDTAAEYLEMDAPETMFLAIDASGALVGLVIGGLRGSGSNGTASFIGVSHRHRGRGYAGQLLGWITERMIAAGAETITGETDDGNFPMAKAFAAVGYPQIEARVDFQRTTH